MVWEHWWLWDRAACVNFHMFTTCTGHFPDPQLSLPVTHAYTHTFIFLLLSVLLFLISCLTDILQPCAYCFSQLLFAKVYCRKCLLDIEMSFFCHIFMFSFFIPIFIVFFTPWGNCSEGSITLRWTKRLTLPKYKGKTLPLTFRRI